MHEPGWIGGAVALPFDESRVEEQIKRIHEYVWARHVDGSDHYDHSIHDDEAMQVLDQYYSAIGNRNSPDQVYLGILLFERAFEVPERQLEYFQRAKRIFEFYRRVTGETEWPTVEDRLEDINSFLGEAEGEGSQTAPEPATAVEEAPPVVDEAPAPLVPPAPLATSVATPAPELVPPEAAPAGVQKEAPPPAEEEDVEKAEPKPVPVAQVTSAAEEQLRETAEVEAARREAAEAFIADLEVVEGMQLVPAGTFLFGIECAEVFIDTFYVDKVPVTNEGYLRFVRETGYRPPRYANDPRLSQPEQPVVGVSFADAQQYAQWAGKELPTERQWEKAARGTDGRPYPWGSDPPGVSDACFGLDPREGCPCPVGRALRNVSPFGVLDSCGNTWEWTASPFAKGSEYKVVRGGSYNDPPEFLRLDFRLDAHPKDKCEAIGFRCVKNIHN